MWLLTSCEACFWILPCHAALSRLQNPTAPSGSAVWSPNGSQIRVYLDPRVPRRSFQSSMYATHNVKSTYAIQYVFYLTQEPLFMLNFMLNFLVAKQYEFIQRNHHCIVCNQPQLNVSGAKGVGYSCHMGLVNRLVWRQLGDAAAGS